MLVHCPSCQASYRLDAAALGGGRTVRCSRCREQWFVTATPERIAPIDDDSVAIDALETSFGAQAIDAEAIEVETVGSPRRAEPRRARRSLFVFPRRRNPRPAWPRVRSGARRALSRLRPSALFAALGVVLIAAAFARPAPVVAAAPSLGRLYAAVGVEVNIRGLSIGRLSSVEQIEDGVPVLVVSGVVDNVSHAEIATPRLRLSVRSADGRELYTWTAVASRATLAPREASGFRARLASPPAEGRSVSVRFLSPQDVAARPGA